METIDLVFSTDKEITIEPLMLSNGYGNRVGVRLSIDELEMDALFENITVEDVVGHFGKEKLLAEINKPEED